MKIPLQYPLGTAEAGSASFINKEKAARLMKETGEAPSGVAVLRLADAARIVPCKVNGTASAIRSPHQISLIEVTSWVWYSFREILKGGG